MNPRRTKALRILAIGVVAASGLALGFGAVSLAQYLGDESTETKSSAGRSLTPIEEFKFGEDPFGPDGGERASLNEAQSKLPFQPLLPSSEKANVDQAEVWVEEGDLRISLVFPPGIIMYAEVWQGIDGPEVWQRMIDSGYPGEILEVGKWQVLGTLAGTNSDESPYPSSVQFTENNVTYEFFALPTSDASFDDLLGAVASLDKRS